MRNDGGTAFWLATAAFIGAVLTLGGAMVGAVQVDDSSFHRSAPEEPAEPVMDPQALLPGAEYTQGTPYPRVSHDEILAAVNHDVFQPHRTPPAERYRLPNERREAGTPSRNDRRRRRPDLRVVGTAIAGDRALALVQPEDSVPFSVLLGEEVEGFLMAAVTEESVTFVRDGNVFQFPVVEPERGRSSRDRSRDDRGQRRSEEAAARALSERVQQAIEALRLQRGQAGQGGVIRGLGVPLGIQMRGGEAGGIRGVVIRGRGGGGDQEGRLP